MIYAVRNDGYVFQELDLEIDDFLDNFPEDVDYNQAHDFSLENLSLSQWWRPVETSFSAIEDDQSAPIPDLAKWIDATLVLSPKAYQAVGEQLSEAGELLPIKVAGETFYIFNCLTIGEVDESLCEKEHLDGDEVGWKTIGFDEADVSTKLIYKTPVQGCLDLFCGEEFKKQIEAHQLSGVVFEQNLVRNFD